MACGHWSWYGVCGATKFQPQWLADINPHLNDVRQEAQMVPLPVAQALRFQREVLPCKGVYKKLVFTPENKLLGGILVGDISDFASLTAVSKRPDIGGLTPDDLMAGKMPAADWSNAFLSPKSQKWYPLSQVAMAPEKDLVPPSGN